MRESENRLALDGTALKWIAVLTMVMDHIGVLLISQENIAQTDVVSLGWAMRVIGRLAFPIFGFLLTEGFIHTGNVRKYALRMFAFAVLSEIPFDLFVFGVPLELSHQNAFVTLFLGILVLESIRRWGSDGAVTAAIIIAFGSFAELIRSDYGILGILMITFSIYIGKTVSGSFVWQEWWQHSVLSPWEERRRWL